MQRDKSFHFDFCQNSCVFFRISGVAGFWCNGQEWQFFLLNNQPRTKIRFRPWLRKQSCTMENYECKNRDESLSNALSGNLGHLEFWCKEKVEDFSTKQSNIRIKFSIVTFMEELFAHFWTFGPSEPLS